ncbi:uncharacterized protein MONBRDRAFT_32184 [Monosiga brevicollis MX1]|uniref:Protein kinase domain-containing protein n=1 Tax=Monosiga brevicollis TaxID=81824 RepID=A9UY69_MONBE|nr:uncharacterized protein MONBRDRAFT_32184 [Monosiga brevicollis MX1]EDQ89807.1 predicted protein [Monosiga brevicollis MX1]|eukprot:XP_001745229.1 hypothetical protein [Monosiga brevicollis MX1]
MAEFSALMEQMKQMQLQSTSEEQHRHIQAQIQALIELEQQRLAAEAEERKLEHERLAAEAEECKLEHERLAAEERKEAQLKRKTGRDKIKVLKGMFANLGWQHETALWNKLMAMDDAGFEAFVDEVDNMPSAERMNEVYPWKAPSQTLSLTTANEVLGSVVAELPCSHHYLAAKIVKRIDDLCADDQWERSEALTNGLQWAAKAQRDSQLTELQQEPSISSRVSIVLQRYFGLNVVHQYAIGSHSTHVDWAGFDDNHHVVVMGECKKKEQPFHEYGGQVANELLRLGAIPTLYESNSNIPLPRRKDILWPIININVVGDHVSAYLALHVIDIPWEQFESCLAEILPLFEIDESILRACKEFVQEDLAYLLDRADARTVLRPRLPPQPFPCPFDHLCKWNLKDSYGPNVQVYSIGKQNKVFKHFDYWGRTANLCSSLSAQCVSYQDRRYPPDDRILTILSQLDVAGSFYQKWEVARLATAVDVLSYPYVKPADTVEIEQLVQVIYQLKAIHSVDFVHGDILPRNILFCSDWEGHPAAFLIDFDLGRFLAANPAHNPVYASNFAREGEPLEPFRHPFARRNLPMQKEHDGFALARVMEKFLQDDEARQQLVAALEELQLDDAATLCQRCSLLPPDNVAGLGKATGSPRR